ncbi:MAG: 50S ribosomal protein L32 [Lentisphaerae bacterium]|jgi:large subunit ribosomal protein L32|nr:50S ribosomal protein L32 [Lentisphaerota bacterium]MBT4821116.1 50S ribosomal protein L32 [Lentisphaerota bacterium]MBT5610349.1 50S ribosomal protein L32 [Lentisphaerota bacterium]MBT7056177.1 50S ribosomal protein L32 [Lentisphaerota bacterium]MBT7841901.1 50S ribosomal protein L32 [Lentisphaerota bacterium]
MAVQQNRVSKRRIRHRKAANRYRGMQVTTCPMCGGTRMPHRVCPSCGSYGGRQVISITAE